MYTGLTDMELLGLLRAGDQAAYREIYDRYWELLYRFSRKMIQDDSLAEDIVQEVFSKIWVIRNQLDENRVLAAYLYKLTRNKILDAIRHSKIESRYLEHLHQAVQLRDALPDQLYIERELFDRIESEIRLLPEKMRVIFEMSRKDFKSNMEIAQELGLSQQTVKNQVSKAMRILKNKLGSSSYLLFLFF